MRIYVDDNNLPIACYGCQFLETETRSYEGSYCYVCEKEFNDNDIFKKDGSNKKYRGCPIKPLSLIKSNK